MSPPRKIWGYSASRNFSSSAALIFAIAMSLRLFRSKVLLPELAKVIKRTYQPPRWRSVPSGWCACEGGYFDDQPDRACRQPAIAEPTARDAGQYRRAHTQSAFGPQQPVGRTDRRTAYRAQRNQRRRKRARGSD